MSTLAERIRAELAEIERRRAVGSRLGHPFRAGRDDALFIDMAREIETLRGRADRLEMAGNGLADAAENLVAESATGTSGRRLVETQHIDDLVKAHGDWVDAQCDALSIGTAPTLPPEPGEGDALVDNLAASKDLPTAGWEAGVFRAIDEDGK